MLGQLLEAILENIPLADSTDVNVLHIVYRNPLKTLKLDYLHLFNTESSSLPSLLFNISLLFTNIHLYSLNLHNIETSSAKKSMTQHLHKQQEDLEILQFDPLK